MGSKAMKLVMVSPNGQISIGKAWAGRQIRVEEVNENEIRISAGVFVPDSQKMFYSDEAKQSLMEFNQFEAAIPAQATNTKVFFSELKKKKARGR